MWSSRAGLNGEQFSHGKKLKYDHNSYGSGIAKNRREFSATDLNGSQHTSGSPGISGLFELKNVGSITSYRPYSSNRTKGSTSDLVKDLYSDLLTSDSVNSWDLASFQGGSYLSSEDPLSTMYDPLYHDHSSPSHRGSPGRSAPMKAIHDLLSLPDTDSGFSSSLKPRNRSLIMSDDFTSSPPTLVRSRSLTRLSPRSRDPSPSASFSHNRSLDKTVHDLKDSLDDSENRRTVLMHKLKEAQGTLQIQNDRLCNIESSAKENSVLVDNLKYKEKDYRRKISYLEKVEEEKEKYRLETVRLKEEMQERIDSLDFQLKSLQSQHQVSESENQRRNNILDQTTGALTLMEEENSKLQRERDALRTETQIYKDSLQLAKDRISSMEREVNILRADIERLREENSVMNKKFHQSTNELSEIKSMAHSLDDESEQMTKAWNSLAQEKVKVTMQQEFYQGTVDDLKVKVTSVMQDRDRLFQEKLDLHSQMQELILDKEQLMKMNSSLDAQVSEQHIAINKVQASTSRRDEKKKKGQEELKAIKKVSEDLSTELSTVKAFYERALEQIGHLENTQKLFGQQLQISEQEKQRLQSEVNRLKQATEGRVLGGRKENDQLQETVMKQKADLRQSRIDRSHLDDRCRELELKLKKANEDLLGVTDRQQTELETWKNTCERLTTSVTRKETELQKLSDRSHDLEELASQLRCENQNYRDQCDQLLDEQDDRERMRDDNRRLQQEKAENEQMIELLEMQKHVLNKSTESSLTRAHDVEQLMTRIDTLRSENEDYRDRVSELEELRDTLVMQKEDLLANSEFVYKTPNMEEFESKIDDLRTANKLLRDAHDDMVDTVDRLQQENLSLRLALNDEDNVEFEESFENMRFQKQQLNEDINHLKHDYEDLQTKYDALVQKYKEKKPTPDDLDLYTILKQKDGVERQVGLLTGQLNLAEGSRKRAESDAARLQAEMDSIKNGSKAEELEAEIQRLKAAAELDRQNAVDPSRVQELEQEARKLQEAGRQAKALEVELETLRTSRQELQTKFTTDMTKAAKRVQELETQVRNLRNAMQRNKVLEDELNSLKAILADKQDESSDIEGKLARRIGELEVDLEDLQGTNARNEELKLEIKNAKTRETCKKTTDDITIKALQKEVDRLRDVEWTRLQLENEMQKMKTSEPDISDLQQQLEKLGSHKRELELKLEESSKFSSELRKSQSQLQDSKKQQVELKSTIQKLTQELSRVNLENKQQNISDKQLLEVKAELGLCKSDFHGKEREVTALRQQLKLSKDQAEDRERKLVELTNSLQRFERQSPEVHSNGNLDTVSMSDASSPSSNPIVPLGAPRNMNRPMIQIVEGNEEVDSAPMLPTTPPPSLPEQSPPSLPVKSPPRVAPKPAPKLPEKEATGLLPQTPSPGIGNNERVPSATVTEEDATDKVAVQYKPAKMHLSDSGDLEGNASSSNVPSSVKSSIADVSSGSSVTSAEGDEKDVNSDGKGNDRLQSLISKYRSFGEKGGLYAERRTRPLSFGGSRLGSGLASRSPAIPSVSAKTHDSKTTSPGLDAIASRLNMSGDASNSINRKNIKTDKPSIETNSGSDKSNGETAGNHNGNSSLSDSQDQKDLNSLLQKRLPKLSAPSKTMLSSAPPKITSKSLAGLLKNGTSSRYTNDASKNGSTS